jgi:hypothetical protein
VQVLLEVHAQRPAWTASSGEAVQQILDGGASGRQQAVRVPALRDTAADYGPAGMTVRSTSVTWS